MHRIHSSHNNQPNVGGARTLSKYIKHLNQKPQFKTMYLQVKKHDTR